MNGALSQVPIEVAPTPVRLPRLVRMNAGPDPGAPPVASMLLVTTGHSSSGTQSPSEDLEPVQSVSPGP